LHSQLHLSGEFIRELTQEVMKLLFQTDVITSLDDHCGERDKRLQDGAVSQDLITLWENLVEVVQGTDRVGAGR